MNYSDSKWSTADDNAQDTAKPGAGDVPIFTANSGNVTMDESSAALGGLTMTGYANTLAMGTYAIDVDGDAVLDGTITSGGGDEIACSGNLTKTSGMTTLPAGLVIIMDGTGNLTCNSVAGGAMSVNSGGTVTCADAQTWTSYTFTAGTVNYASQTLTVAGAISLGAVGTHQNISVVEQTVSADLKWSRSNQGAGITEYRLANGLTATLTGVTYIQSFQAGMAGTITGAFGLIVRFAGDNFWQPAATAVFSMALVRFWRLNGLTPGGAVTLADADLEIIGYDESFTLDGDVDLGTGTLWVYNYSWAGKYSTLVANGYDITAQTITLGGTAATTGGGKLDCSTAGTTITCTDIAAGNAANTLNFFEFADVLVHTGTFTGTTIDCDARVGDACTFTGTGTVTDVDADNNVNAFAGPCVDGGGNTNITFVAPGGGGGSRLALIGVGR